jgi:hypothetical protein
MSEPEETQAIDQVIDRLAQRFPTLERGDIENVVDEEQRQLDGGRVRDFVPVLVEKAAEKRLRKRAKASGVVAEQPEALGPLPDGGPAPDPMEVERASREGHRGPLLGDLLGGGASANER